MRRKHDDSADKMAELAGLANSGNNLETIWKQTALWSLKKRS